MQVLLFHIGRGGHFNNAGYLSCKGIGGINQSPIIMNRLYFHPTIGLDNEGNCIEDTSDDAELINFCGNGLGITFGELKSNEGRIDYDGEYNTWYTNHSDNLNDNEAQAVIKYYKDYEPFIHMEDLDVLKDIADNNNMNDDVAKCLQEALYTSFLNIKVFVNEWLSSNGYDTIPE